MSKKSKILIALLTIFLLLVLYLVFTSEQFKNKVTIVQQANEQKVAQLENDYQPKVKELFVSYQAMVRENNFTAEKITELKNKLLELKVPAKFKELHLNFVLALIKIENYLSRKDDQEKVSSLQMANQIKADYSWLNQ